MLRFLTCPPTNERYAAELHGAHAFGADSVPLRAEFSSANHTIRCDPRANTPAGLSLLWPAKNCGVYQLETTRLPALDKPYHLHVELARHRLMRISQKREEWGLFDYPGMEDIANEIDRARDLFITALEKIDDPAAAARAADEALALSLEASERMCRFHATVFLARRQQAGGFAKPFLGVAAPHGPAPAAVAKRLTEAFDFIRVPFVWREIQPKEQETRFESTDEWIKLANSAKLGVRGGPLLNFGVRFVPDWMYIWENDHESILEYSREHVRRTVQRYASQINSWVVAGGLHADSVFSFSFEQIMELTRMAAQVTKQVAPRAQVVLDITQPFGEYYARNQRTIPPLLYADMAVQSGIPFDAFGLQFVFGLDSDGYHLRDFLQISALIDRLANLGKPIHITAVGVPSTPSIGLGGYWKTPWSEATQADWLVTLSEIALSKPYVENICLHLLADTPHGVIPSAGVLREDLAPKPAFNKLVQFRKRLQSESAK
ncbi:MAG: endo-1,4-beta-xylanase [Phycisphaerae bacterium]